MEIKNQSSHLSLEVNGSPAFFLNYTAPLTFRIVINPFLDCFNGFKLAVQNDAVIFDKPKTPGGLSPGFTMYDAEPEGRSYFPRN